MRLGAVLAAVLAASVTVSFAQPGGQRPGAVRQGVDRQMPPRDRRQADAERGTSVLRGFVVASDTGNPIRRALVRISGQGVPSRIATTDSQGRFEIKELPAGRYMLTASKGGFVPLQYGQRRPSESGTPIDLAAAQVIDKIVIGLPRGSVISGRISDEFGEPIANAVVSAMRYGYIGGTRRLMPGGARDTTDDLGQFRLFGLSPGEYVVSAAFRAGPQEVTDPSDEPNGYAPTYYPGTPNVADAQRIAVAVGQEQSNVTFALISTRLVRVTGTVISSQGLPVTSGMVTLNAYSSRGVPPMMQMITGRIDGSGQFRVTNVAPGRYIAQVRSARGRGFDNDAEFGRQDITVGGDDLDGIVILTGPGARVYGQVTNEINAPPAIRAQQVQVAARLANPDQTMPGAAGAARVNDDWTFEIAGLFEPRLFRVGLPEGWMLKYVLLNGQDITDTPLDVPTGQTVTGVQIVITDKTTDVNGRVTDVRGAAVTDVTVVVFPADDSRWTYQSRFIRTARPDQDGRFDMRDLPPLDRYLAVAVQGLEDGQAGDPDFLRRIVDLGTSFTLGDGETKVVDLRFAPR